MKRKTDIQNPSSKTNYDEIRKKLDDTVRCYSELLLETFSLLDKIEKQRKELKEYRKKYGKLPNVTKEKKAKRNKKRM